MLLCPVRSRRPPRRAAHKSVYDPIEVSHPRVSHSRENAIDPTPYFDAETSSVCFCAHACGLPVRAFVTRDWLRSRFGQGVPEDSRMVDAYVEHAAEIDAEVARRFTLGRLEPVWLASAFPPID